MPKERLQRRTPDMREQRFELGVTRQEVTKLCEEKKWRELGEIAVDALVRRTGNRLIKNIDLNRPESFMVMAEAVNATAKSSMANRPWYMLKAPLITAAIAQGCQWGVAEEVPVDGEDNKSEQHKKVYFLHGTETGVATFHDPNNEMPPFLKAAGITNEKEWTHGWARLGRQDDALEILSSYVRKRKNPDDVKFTDMYHLHTTPLTKHFEKEIKANRLLQKIDEERAQQLARVVANAKGEGLIPPAQPDSEASKRVVQAENELKGVRATLALLEQKITEQRDMLQEIHRAYKETKNAKEAQGQAVPEPSITKKAEASVGDKVTQDKPSQQTDRTSVHLRPTPVQASSSARLHALHLEEQVVAQTRRLVTTGIVATGAGIGLAALGGTLAATGVGLLAAAGIGLAGWAWNRYKRRY